ncbi:MAG: division/cell wall cluster transcriptional repressor MraZ [Myxococcales bacterium]|nr:division/cell wall cluster transcriptional repressor MraZ [Myxococcales bacterium]
MNGFLGRYEHQMDEKGRVSLPSAFRRAAQGDRFVLLQWEAPYLTLFPPEVWGEVQARLVDFRKSERGAWHHVREILSTAVEVGPDKQGRILVPSWLQESANLGGTVLLNGNIDRIEIWDPATYDTTVRKAAGADLAQVAHRIFG